MNLRVFYLTRWGLSDGYKSSAVFVMWLQNLRKIFLCLKQYWIQGLFEHMLAIVHALHVVI